MPSPFPGMDPYLEGAEWSSFHALLAAEIARQLTPQLRPRYVALPQRRYVTDSGDALSIFTGTPLSGSLPTGSSGSSSKKGQTLYPDVGIVQTSFEPLPSGDSQLVVLDAPLRLMTVMPDEIPIYSVEIQDVKERRLVTLIEIFSPVNKWGEGYEEYLQKRQRILRSNAHLVEIDLLRKGKRVPMRQALPKAAYFVFVSRVAERPLTEVWPIQLRQPLPRIMLPLLPGDADIPFDLQAAFTQAYDAVGYDLILDYIRPPDAPLDAEDREWGRQVVG